MLGSLSSIRSKLDSAEAKLRRADQHFRSFEHSIKRFRNKDPYTVTFDNSHSRPGPRIAQPLPGRRTPAGQQIYSEVYTYVDVPIFLQPKPGCGIPSLKWGLLIGDIIHNLSSALDNCAWAASIDGLSKIQYPGTVRGQKDREADERLVAFPVCVAESDWAAVCSKNLRFVDPGVVTIFEKYQPFYAWKCSGANPQTHPLRVIRELWNRDKHRFVQTVVGAASLQGATAHLLSSSPNPTKLRAEPIEVFQDRPVEGTTEVGTVRVHLRDPVNEPTKLDVKVDCNFNLAVLFDQTSPVPLANVSTTILEARNLIADLLNNVP